MQPPEPGPRPARQSGPDDLVTEVVRGVPVRCYADRPRSPVHLLDAALPEHADAPLLVDPALDRTVSYDGFARLVEGAAGSLLARGLAPGDRVALLARNGLEAAVAIWACARAGLVHVGLPADAPVPRLRELVALTGPALLLAQPGLAALAAAAGEAAEDRPVAVPVADAGEGLLGAERPWRGDGPRPDEDATYMLIATSGTTGRPKAVRVTGRMSGHAAVHYAQLLGLTPQDRTAVHLPFAWVSGHVTQLGPAMRTGGSVVTMPSFTPGALVRTVVDHGVTWLDVVPSMWEMLLRHDGFALPGFARVRAAVFGGAPAAPGTLERVRERLPQLRLVDVYASSETCAPVTVLGDVEGRRRPGTVGRPAPYVDVRLVAATGEDVARGEAGELWVRSPTVTPGYWTAPGSGGDAPSPVTADGWLRTGDLARLDDEGYVAVVGRAVDLVIRGGVNVYPAEVERALLASGVLADAAVVGLPSAVAGENVAAAVVALPGAAVDPAALQALVRDRVGAHAVPRPLRVVTDLPRNRHGKTDRVAVRALLAR